jgi:nucleotidyltransferase substrate binding protein (TIGR01987 family)
MESSHDTRWKLRFHNYKKALKTLTDAVNLSSQRQLSELEKQGFIQGFEFTHELFWKTLKDFLNEQGNQNIYGSKDATREAFNLGLIKNGEVWMQMIESRNLSSHTYNSEISQSLVDAIVQNYFNLFKEFEQTMEGLL